MLHDVIGHRQHRQRRSPRSSGRTVSELVGRVAKHWMNFRDQAEAGPRAFQRNGRRSSAISSVLVRLADRLPQPAPQGCCRQKRGILKGNPGEIATLSSAMHRACTQPRPQVSGTPGHADARRHHSEGTAAAPRSSARSGRTRLSMEGQSTQEAPLTCRRCALRRKAISLRIMDVCALPSHRRQVVPAIAATGRHFGPVQAVPRT